ncbi:MAG: hypothetical protein RIR26_2198 [Pseudomonadota bacterium]
MKVHSNSETLSLLDNRLTLTLHSDARYVVLRFNDAPSRNAVSFDMAAALFEMVKIAQDPNASHPLSRGIQSGNLLAIVLKSELPQVFLSGGHLKEIVRFTADEGQHFTHCMNTFTTFLRAGPLVSVALLNGVAAGGGSEIALSADYRIALNARAQLELAQARWGVPAGWGMMTDLLNKGVYASERRRSLAVLSQESWNLERLLQLGLVDAQCDEDKETEAEAEAEANWQHWLNTLLNKVAACPTELRTALLQTRNSLTGDALQHFDEELFKQFWLSDEHLSRVSGYLENRKNKLKSE